MAIRYAIGKFLEAWGLALTGYALYVGIEQESMRAEFTLLGLGVIVFLAGYVVTGRRD